MNDRAAFVKKFLDLADIQGGGTAQATLIALMCMGLHDRPEGIVVDTEGLTILVNTICASYRFPITTEAEANEVIGRALMTFKISEKEVALERAGEFGRTSLN